MENLKIIKIKEPSKVFFISDTHFNHKNAIEYNNRPFNSVEEMNEEMIKNWNKVVPKDGIVFHIGDFAFGGSSVWKSIIPRLNGDIYLVLGNHDIRNWRNGYTQYFKQVAHQMYVNISGYRLVLNHFPFAALPQDTDCETPIIQIFGHVHHKEQEDRLNLQRTQYNVCADLNNYTPISFVEILNKL